ncbi:MAG: dihydrodipicolinate synthase family protein [Acidobacteriota bacterium]
MMPNDIPPACRKNLKTGTVIPAMPLALNEQRHLDERHQRALIRYYLDSGAGGIAAGVHTTQFEIRSPKFGLLEPVLSLVSREIDSYSKKTGNQIFKISGVCGRTPQAVKEAVLAKDLGFHAVLLSLAAMSASTTEQLIEHCRTISGIMPLFGFYLQSSVGGRDLPYSFWRKFVEIENVAGIKIAPFNRYKTLDVVRALADAGREKEIPLYTGNDDNILADLLTEYLIPTKGGVKKIRMVGGLLGHWSVWTKKAVKLLSEIHSCTSSESPIPQELLSRGQQITDANAAFFDAANNYKGCIAGIHQVLKMQGLLRGTWCLNPDEHLSNGQLEEITRVYSDYPHLNDDEFVRENLDRWLTE